MKRCREFEARAKGGARQQRARAEATSAAALEPSALAGHTMNLWAWGHMSPQQVQKIMSLMKADLAKAREGKLDDHDVNVLASLGSGGAFSGNCHRDLMRSINPPSIMKGIQQHDVLAKSHLQSLTKTTRPQSLLLPHVLFAILYHDHHEAFESRARGAQGKLQSFWRDMEGTPLLNRHPVRHRAGYAERCIPLAIHGDGVPVTHIGRSGSKSCDFFNWSSLLGQGCTLDATVFITGAFSDLNVKGETLNAIWAVIAWSLTWLWESKWPDRDHHGIMYRRPSVEGKRALTPLADGFFGAVLSVRGDLDYFGKVLRLNWYTSLRPCAICDANSTPNDSMSWSNFRPEASWMDSCWTDSAWREAYPAHHVVFDVPAWGSTA